MIILCISIAHLLQLCNYGHLTIQIHESYLAVQFKIKNILAMLPNLHFLVPLITSLPHILDCLHTVDENVDSMELIIMLNFINIILLISSIIKAYLSINEDPIYEMDAHELIELLMGYRY